MVQSGKTLRSVSAAALVAIFLLSTAPVPGAADSAQSHWGTSFPVPKRGMEIFVEGPHANSTVLFATETSERLAGHHEWRRVINATRTTYYDWEHEHPEHGGNGSHGYERDDVFDLKTGLLLGQGYSFGWENPLLFGGTPIDGVLTHRSTHSGFWGYGITTHDLLPESVLWGRSIWLGEDWDLSISLSHCDAASGQVATSGDWWANSTAPFDVVVSMGCSTEFSGSLYEWEARWDLSFPDGAALLATNRTLTIEYSYGNHTGTYTNEFPAHVTHNGTWSLPFEGASHSRFVAPRDNTLSYAGYDGLFPADPDPHAYFDMRQAGAEAVRLDDEDVRLFFATAEDPVLLHASMYRSDLGQVRWVFYFGDESGGSLYVHMTGVKVPGGPLTVTDRDTYRGSSGGSFDFGEIGETAAPGDLARTMDQALATRDNTVKEYGWQRDWWPSTVQMYARYDGFHVNPFEDSDGTVVSDASTGIVSGQTQWDSRIRLSPYNL